MGRKKSPPVVDSNTGKKSRKNRKRSGIGDRLKMLNPLNWLSALLGRRNSESDADRENRRAARREAREREAERERLDEEWVDQESEAMEARERGLQRRHKRENEKRAKQAKGIYAAILVGSIPVSVVLAIVGLVAGGGVGAAVVGGVAFVLPWVFTVIRWMFLGNAENDTEMAGHFGLHAVVMVRLNQALAAFLGFFVSAYVEVGAAILSLGGVTVERDLSVLLPSAVSAREYDQEVAPPSRDGIAVKCTRCSHVFRAPEERRGHFSPCPSCNENIKVGL